jgi:putative hydrolase of HD superfamily
VEEFIKFFVEIGKLKTIQRRGWLLRGIKNPESVADHAFRVLLLAWIFGKERNINVKRLLKLALVHSLSAVYIDYISPYDKLLEIKGRREIIKKYPALALRAPIDQKGKIAKQRLEEEKKAIKKLTKDLPEPINHEINYLWLDFQERGSREAKFLRALDKIENLIQAYEYKDEVKEDILTPFLVQINEVTYDPRLLKFVKNLEIYIRKGKEAVKNKTDKNLIEFILEVGKLKKIKRIGWIYGGAKEAETESIAAHTFRLALMSCCLVGRRHFSLERLIKMSLVHDFVIIYTGDTTPFDDLISGNLKKDKPILEKWPTRRKEDKERLTIERRYKEKKALDKLLKDLPKSFQDEVLSLWFEYEEGFSKEGRFVSQVDRIEKLLQAIDYNARGIYKPKIDPYWTQLKILLDDPSLINFVEQIDQWFFNKKAHKSVDKPPSDR